MKTDNALWCDVVKILARGTSTRDTANRTVEYIKALRKHSWCEISVDGEGNVTTTPKPKQGFVPEIVERKSLEV